MYARVYMLRRLCFNKLLKMLKILSMLAIDLETEEDENPDRYSTMYAGYLVEHIAPGILPHIEPVFLLQPIKHVHKRQLLLEYSGVKLLGLGSFRIGRTSRDEPVVEIAEQSLLAHLDLRGRRLVVDNNLMSKRAKRLAYWFTPIAMAAGLHRWGFSWRRIIASTIAVAWHHGVEPLYDIEAVAASFVEYAYNRLRYNIYGEERYMVPEALKYITYLQREIREAMNAANCVKDPAKFLMDTLDRLIDEVEKVLRGEVETLKEMLDRLDTRERRKHWSLLGVYGSGFSSLVGALRENRAIEEVSAENNAILLVPSETWSPLYLAALIGLAKRENINELKVVIGYTPQILPQIVFSIEVLEDYNVKIEKKGGEGGERDQLPKITLTVKKHEDKEVKLTLYMVPLIAKTPTIAYHQLKIVQEKIKANKLMYIPKHIALAPTIAALKKLEQENKASTLHNP